MNKKTLLSMSDSALDKTVQIAGTKYDRRRKVTPDMKNRMSMMANSGKSYKEIGNKYNVLASTVRYNLDEDFKKSENARRTQYAVNSTSNPAERIAYKRSLIEANKKLPINA